MRGGNNMTEPSQYFKGRTVQEQMDEVIGYVDTRAAEVATAAIASDVAQVHQDMLNADADAQAAAASAAAAAGTLANAVKKVGEASQSIDGDIDLNDDLNVDGDATVRGALAVAGTASLVDVAVSNKIEVPTPSTNADAATKKYVDDADALKINIADINQYAVGLTGNQANIAGKKSFNDLMLNPHQVRIVNDYYGWFKFTAAASNTYNGSAIVKNRNGLSIFDFKIDVDGDSKVSSVTIVNSYITSNTNVDYIGAYTKDGNVYVVLHANGTNRYYAPLLIGLYYGTGIIRSVNFEDAPVTIEADYQEVLMP